MRWRARRTNADVKKEREFFEHTSSNLQIQTSSPLENPVSTNQQPHLQTDSAPSRQKAAISDDGGSDPHLILRVDVLRAKKTGCTGSNLLPSPIHLIAHHHSFSLN